MPKIRHFAIALLAALAFCACATTPPPPEPLKIADDELKLVLIKSKNIRFYDFGTLSVEYDKGVESASTPSLRTSEASVAIHESIIDCQDSEQCAESSAKIPQKIELRIFKLGKFLGSFVVIKSEICYTDFDKRDDCAPKWVAARSFFGNVSYGELFEDIFQKNDIFEGQGKRLEPNGAIIQEFTYGGQRFYYERSAKRIYFKNLSNGVIVSIEDYKK